MSYQALCNVHAETTITIVWHFGKTEQIHNMTTIFTHNSLGWKKVVILSIYSVLQTVAQPDSKIKSESSESNQFCRKIGPINYSRCLLFLCFIESNTTFPNHEKVTTKHWKELQFSPFEVSILSSLLTALHCSVGWLTPVARWSKTAKQIT